MSLACTPLVPLRDLGLPLRAEDFTAEVDHVVRQVADVPELAFSGPALEVVQLEGTQAHVKKNLAGLRAYGFLAFRV